MCIPSIVRLMVPSASEEGQARLWHIGITAVFLTASYLIALVVTDLGVILAIVGATGSTMVSYVLPGAPPAPPRPFIPSPLSSGTLQAPKAPLVPLVLSSLRRLPHGLAPPLRPSRPPSRSSPARPPTTQFYLPT